MKKYWWKIICIVLLFYTVILGFLIEVPRMPILNETIRNLFFHVTMWFSMIVLLLVSVVNSIRYLSSQNQNHDTIASESAITGIFFGLLGLLTGSIWARFTWGAWWTNDAQLNGAAVTMLAYLAYMVLRNSIEEEQKRARISAVYNIFAFVMMLVFIGVLPRMTDSLHPGKGGNPGFNTYDMDSSLRMVFYPALFGFILLGVWIMQLRIRLKKIENSEQN
jgi:heme exporter protein C